MSGFGYMKNYLIMLFKQILHFGILTYMLYQNKFNILNIMLQKMVIMIGMLILDLDYYLKEKFLLLYNYQNLMNMKEVI